MNQKAMIIQEKQETEEKNRTISKEALVAAKERLETEIARFEKKELNDHTRSLLQNLHEVTSALSTMQDMINLIWKRTEQMHEELAHLRSKTE